VGFARRVPRLGRVLRGHGRQDRQQAGGAAGQDLDAAIGKLLENDKGPSRKTGELDNRGSQFYLALYWAQELAEQTEDQELAEHFAKLAKALSEEEETVIAELAEVQGNSVDIGGYYYPDREKTTAVMRPSKTLNATLEAARG
jgi:isocitrate dehydrogenase